jgi:DNA-binding MarR family transcriptional regulator
MTSHRHDGPLPGMGLDLEQQRAWLAYMRVNLQLTYEMNHQLLANSELSLADYHVLSKLRQAPGRRLRISALAQETGWERSRASHQVRRMGERGLIAAKPAADDKRATEITVTDRGNAAFRHATRGHAALVRELFFSGISRDLLNPLTEALEQVYATIVQRGALHRRGEGVQRSLGAATRGS